MFDKKFGGTDLPGEVEDTLIIFEKLFQKYAPIIQRDPEILANVFGDERIVDYYINATEKDTISATNTLKQRQNDIKRAAERGEIDLDDDGSIGGYGFPFFGR